MADAGGISSGPGKYLGRGIYDLVEAARIIGRSPDTIGGWTKGSSPLHPVAHDRILSFMDLISLWVISELSKRGVPKGHIRSGRDYVAEQADTEYPFAHRYLATVGAGFFAKLDRSEDWVDAGQGGQGSFQMFIQNLIQPIEYGPDLHAAKWRPAQLILLDPKIQAGAPCIEGTRIPTTLVAKLNKAGEHKEDIAEDMRLNITQVNAALEYELAA